VCLDSSLSDTVPTIPMLDTHKLEDTQAGLVPTLHLDNQAIPTLEWVVILIPVYNLTQVPVLQPSLPPELQAIHLSQAIQLQAEEV